MFSLASSQDVAQGVDGSQGHYISSHELVGSDEAVTMWNLRDQDWHLFSSYGFLVKTSIAHVTTEIRHTNCNNNWYKDIDIL